MLCQRALQGSGEPVALFRKDWLAPTSAGPRYESRLIADAQGMGPLSSLGSPGLDLVGVVGSPVAGARAPGGSSLTGG